MGRTPVAMRFVVLLLACGEPRGEPGTGAADAASRGQATLSHDSVSLTENDDVFIGNPFSLVVVPTETDGGVREIWVSDFNSNTLLQFDGSGRFVRRVGGAGEGPHEFSTVGQLFLTADEVGAVELRRREVKWFNRDNGSLKRISRFETGSIGMSPPVVLGDALAFPLLDPIARTSVGFYDATKDEWTRTGPLPEPYRRSYERGRGAFASYFRYIYMDRFDATSVLMAFSGVDSLYRFDRRDTVWTALGAVPRRIRRGIEGECRFAGDAPDPAQAMKGCGSPRELFSVLSGAWVLDDGRIAVVHTDQQTEGEPPRVVVTGTSYLTVLDLDTGTACVDLPIPGGRDARAVHDLKAAALYILDRRVDDTRSTLWLLRVPVPEPSTCATKDAMGGWRVRSERSRAGG